MEITSYLSSHLCKIPRVLPAGLEPAACGLGIHRSIHLSYGSTAYFLTLHRLYGLPCPITNARSSPVLWSEFGHGRPQVDPLMTTPLFYRTSSPSSTPFCWGRMTRIPVCLIATLFSAFAEGLCDQHTIYLCV